MQTNFSQSDLIKKGMSDTPMGQKIGKFVMGGLVLTIILGILHVALPWIKPIFDNIADIASDIRRIGIYGLVIVLGAMFLKAQWRNIGYFNDYMARKAFSAIITYDPFLIQEKQILSAEHDVEKMMDEKTIIDGKYTELSKKIDKYQKDYLTAVESQKIVEKNIRTTSDPKQITILNLDIQDCVSKQVACKNYIDTISPIANDMRFMIEFISEGYQILKRRIKSAKQELTVNKDIFESANAGASALERMKKAMVGDIELNNDAERAQLAIMQRTALLVGQMKVSMEIISDVTRSANLEEGGQLAAARKSLEALNLTSGQSIPLTNNTANFGNTLQLKDMQFNYNNQLPD